MCKFHNLQKSSQDKTKTPKSTKLSGENAYQKCLRQQEADTITG